MGYQVGASCYATSAEATNAYWSVSPPSMWIDSGGNMHWIKVGVKSDGSWAMIEKWYERGFGLHIVSSDVPAPSISFPACTVSVPAGGEGVTECYPSAVTVAPCGAGFAPYLQVVPVPYDYAQGGALWAFGFSFVLGLWFVSRNIGMILDAVKRY